MTSENTPPWYLLTGYAKSRGRAKEMVDLFDEGISITDLAARYNLTYARAHQIITKARGPRRSVKVSTP